MGDLAKFLIHRAGIERKTKKLGLLISYPIRTVVPPKLATHRFERDMKGLFAAGRLGKHRQNSVDRSGILRCFQRIFRRSKTRDRCGHEAPDVPQRFSTSDAQVQRVHGEEVHRSNDFAKHHDGQTHAAFHAHFPRDRGPRAIAQFTDVFDEEQISLSPGSTIEPDTFGERGRHGDVPKSIADVAGVMGKPQLATLAIQRPVRSVRPSELVTHGLENGFDGFTKIRRFTQDVQNADDGSGIGVRFVELPFEVRDALVAIEHGALHLLFEAGKLRWTKGLRIVFFVAF